MQQLEIDKQLSQDYQKFLDEPYNKSVPDNLISLFESGLMIIPPQAHGINFHKVKSIISKKTSELSVSDINDIVKVVWNCPLQHFHDSLFEAIPEQIKLERFVLKYNQYIEEFKARLNQKRTTLATLSDGVLKTNGMRIIPNG